MTKKVKSSLDPSAKEKEYKETNYSFRFDNFKTTSEVNTSLTFNSNYKSREDFDNINSELFYMMKILSEKNYNNTIVSNDLKKIMHFKLLTNEDAIQRINEIIEKVYGGRTDYSKELEEGSSFLEFGISGDSRFIAVLLDYHIISLLYPDPNHLTFPDTNFDINRKMSYTFPPLYNLKNNIHNDKTTTNVVYGSYDGSENKYLDQKDREELKSYRTLTKQLYDKEISEEDTIEYLKELEKEKRNEN